MNNAVPFFRIGIGVAVPDVLDGALKHAPPDSLLDEFREIALFHALGAQECAQGQIGVLRDLDTPADGLFFHFCTYTLKLINTYTSIVGQNGPRVKIGDYTQPEWRLPRGRIIQNVAVYSSPSSLPGLSSRPMVFMPAVRSSSRSLTTCLCSWTASR